MKAVLVSVLIALGLTACASGRMSGADRLALFESHAGMPVSHVRYFDPMGWERVDDQHVVLHMRPTESWLLTLSGPCLSWSSGSPLLKVSSLNGMMLSTFDKVTTPDSRFSCMIQEIRPIDMQGL